jgi:hypothetical protein
MIHIHVSHAEAIEFLRRCDALEEFISADSICGRLIIATRQFLNAEGVIAPGSDAPPSCIPSYYILPHEKG